MASAALTSPTPTRRTGVDPTPSAGPQTLLGRTVRQLAWVLLAAEPVLRLLDGIGEARTMPVVGAIADALKPTQEESPYRIPPMMRLVDPAKLRC